MTMRYAHLATNDLDGCVVVLEVPRCGGSDSAAAKPESSPMQEKNSEPVAAKAKVRKSSKSQ
jgi:hypothetical protein